MLFSSVDVFCSLQQNKNKYFNVQENQNINGEMKSNAPAPTEPEPGPDPESAFYRHLLLIVLSDCLFDKPSLSFFQITISLEIDNPPTKYFIEMRHLGAGTVDIRASRLKL